MTDLLSLFNTLGSKHKFVSHFTGNYDLIVGHKNHCLIFEKIEQNEYLIRADVFEIDVICLSELIALAKTISNAFSQPE